MSTLNSLIARRLRENGDAPALWWDDRWFTFRDLDLWSARLAGGLLRRNVVAGSRVAVGVPSSPELIAAVLAVLRSGAVLVPINPLCSAAEAEYIVRDCGAALVLAGADQGRALELPLDIVTDVGELDAAPAAFASRDAEDPAVIVYTSGTTGLPKGAVLSQRALRSNLTTVAEAWQWTAADRLLLTLPTFHLHGLALGILGSLVVGSSIVLRPRFVADEVPALLGRHSCSMFFGVPTMYNRLVVLADAILAAADLSAMRLWVSGSAPLTPSTFARFRARFGHDILERFGMSEGGFMIATPYQGPRRAGVVGHTLPGIDIELVDPDAADGGTLKPVSPGEPGEIAIRGPNLFSGYWQRPEDTRQAFVEGFFRSGDLAVREPDGMIRIVGRLSVDIIKSRGFKISAVEIENCLQTHPAVTEVAVIGVPDADRGQAVVAVVTAAPEAAVSAEALRSFARQHLAPHKVPARVVLLDEIPRTGPGKFNKRELIDLFK